MGETEISWTHRPGTVGRSWNPIQGCSRVSEGCRNCYAERLAARFAESGWSQGLINLKTRKWNGTVRLAPHKLSEPLRWRQPSTVFANSMSDLFHEGFTNEEIAAVFGVMAASPQHTFQILTKRAKRMREWFEWIDNHVEEIAVEDSGADCGVNIHEARAEALSWLLADCSACEIGGGPTQERDRWYDILSDGHRDAWARNGKDGGTEWSIPWPLPNVWLGVSVENQEAADERIPELLELTPAAIRFLSCEPLIGPLDVQAYLSRGSFLTCPRCRFASNAPTAVCANDGTRMVPDFGIDWVIAGCESGPGARPCEVEWLRSLRDQCEDAGVAYFLKQAVGAPPETEQHMCCAVDAGPDSKCKAGGVIELPYLDGVQHCSFPEIHS